MTIVLQRNALPGKFGSWHPCGFYLDTYTNLKTNQIPPSWQRHSQWQGVQQNIPEWLGEHDKEAMAFLQIQSRFHGISNNHGQNRGLAPLSTKPNSSTINVPSVSYLRHPQMSSLHVLTGQTNAMSERCGRSVYIFSPVNLIGKEIHKHLGTII